MIYILIESRTWNGRKRQAPMYRWITTLKRIDDFFLMRYVDVDNVFLKLIIKNNINYFKYFLLLNKKMIGLRWMEKKLLPWPYGGVNFCGCTVFLKFLIIYFCVFWIVLLVLKIKFKK
jgi:hypothetical protein